MKSNTVQAADQPIYYVYALLDTRVPGPFKYGRHVFKFKPFYIGKGCGTRHQKHITMARGNGIRSESQKSIKIRNIVKQTGKAPDFRIIKDRMSEQDAYDFERKLVQTIGRIQLKTGPLTNKSDGAERQSRSKALVEAHAGRDPKIKAKIACKIRDSVAGVHARRTIAESEAIAERISETLRNKSPEDRQRLSAGNVMRGLLKRSGLAMNHPVVRPQLDLLIGRTEWDGRALTLDRFFARCARLIDKTN